jgi:hypothetical protein
MGAEIRGQCRRQVLVTVNFQSTVAEG